ncbi:glycosyl hydrolase 6-domain-containing protein [Jimgerdemannia flammicorona]|uniref:Glycosyl hydrolase 6-domain-containing protein n=1 Tax=Jimgerdemannia flammicorona TaxID=994334 RepID=A0A433QUP1_9FUNG|nr:glycosyl hydrolase 6-domain-containing protein [Jimgerdemannia flammicorona]
MRPSIPFAKCRRQVHLDFHTGPTCENVGRDFDKETFAQTVKNAHINSMTVFAKCYYPTKFGKMHPYLDFDLLGAQIEALHSVGARAPIYLTMNWDDYAGEIHSEWVVVEKSGIAKIRPPLTAMFGWAHVDVLTGYGEYLVSQVREILDMYGDAVDGFFFDICAPQTNYSAMSQARMRSEGVEIDNDGAVWEYVRVKYYAYVKRLSDVVLKARPDASIFYNSSVKPTLNLMLPYQTHLEIESLPTGGWAWGDFGGIKTSHQLEYEVGTIVAAGGLISVGDQLHPHGVLDPAVYTLIGKCFGKIESLEPWLNGAVTEAEVALLAVGNMDPAGKDWDKYNSAHFSDLNGAAQMFLERGVQFDVIEATTPIADKYKMLVLSDGSLISDDLRDRITEFIARGGKLILSGTAVKNDIPAVPVRYVSPAPTTPSYLRLDTFLTRLPSSELSCDYDYVFYDTAHVVEPTTSTAESFGTLSQALFNRTWKHLTSHAHAPVGDSLGSPIVVRDPSVLYFAAPLLGSFMRNDYWCYRDIVLAALEDWMPRRLIVPRAPGWMEFSLHVQVLGTCKRKIVHIVAYHPRRTWQSKPHVDQGWSVTGVGFRLLDAEGWGLPRRVYLAPEEEEVEFKMKEGYVDVELEKVEIHTVVVVEW